MEKTTASVPRVVARLAMEEADGGSAASPQPPLLDVFPSLALPRPTTFLDTPPDPWCIATYVGARRVRAGLWVNGCRVGAVFLLSRLAAPLPTPEGDGVWVRSSVFIAFIFNYLVLKCVTVTDFSISLHLLLIWLYLLSSI